MTTKREQRSQMRRALRDAFENTPEAALRFSREACEHLVCLERFISAKTILAYFALPGECNPASAVATAYGMGKTVAFPVCAENYELLLCVPNGDNAIQRGAYGILEPIVERSTLLSPKELDLIIVPGLAFDSNCNRLGRGAGYYDRMLPKTNAFKAAIAFDAQILLQVPVDVFDIAMDCVVTPSSVYRRI